MRFWKNGKSPFKWIQVNINRKKIIIKAAPLYKFYL